MSNLEASVTDKFCRIQIQIIFPSTEVSKIYFLFFLSFISHEYKILYIFYNRFPRQFPQQFLVSVSTSVILIIVSIIPFRYHFFFHLFFFLLIISCRKIIVTTISYFHCAAIKLIK